MTANDRDRRPQLVAGVADEATLTREGQLEAIEHQVEGAAELGELVVALERRFAGSCPTR